MAESSKKKKPNLIPGFVISIIVIAVFPDSASGFGVVQPYWYPDYPMQLSPGETGIAYLNLQNMVGEDDMDVTITITRNDANIASLPDDVEEFIFFMPLGSTKSVPITVTVPIDANIGHEYGITVNTVGCPSPGGMFCYGFNSSWPVQVLPPKIFIDDVSLPEGNSGTTLFEFTVNLSGATLSMVTVDYTTEDGSATLADNDYQFSSGTIIFEPNQTEQTIAVFVNGDTKHEIDETFLVNLSNPNNGTIIDAQGIGTIQADDLIPELSINDVSLPEGNSGVKDIDFTVLLSHPIGYPVKVDYNTEDGSATLADNDYYFSGGTIIFEPNETVKHITVSVNGDTKREEDETFYVNLSNSINATIIDSGGICTIQNEDIEWLNILYVDDDASPGGDGRSWGTAYKYLQDALKLAEYADEIRIAQGIYRPDEDSNDPNGTGEQTATFQLIGSVALKGGYAGLGTPDPNTRDIALYETILSGDLDGNDGEVDVQDLRTDPNRFENSFHVITGTASMTTLDGLIITGGNANGLDRDDQCGGGIHYCDATVTNCTIKQNSASWAGAGIYKGNNPIFKNCVFKENSAYMVGSALANCWRAQAIGCTFTGNMSSAMSWNWFMTLNNCIISENGYGFYNQTSYLSNCIIIKNGIGITHCNDTISNCTISGNLSYGIYMGVSGGTTVINSIIWDDEIDDSTGGGFIAISNSCVQGGWPGLGNINIDPNFADPDKGDYHLMSQAGRWDPNSQSWIQDDVTSPCIDAGNPGCPLGDEPNDVNNLRINMGAYGGTIEASRSPAGWSLLADLTNDGIVNFEDLAYQIKYWEIESNKLPGDLNRNGIVDTYDLAISTDDWLNQTSWAQP